MEFLGSPGAMVTFEFVKPFCFSQRRRNSLDPFLNKIGSSCVSNLLTLYLIYSVQ